MVANDPSTDSFALAKSELEVAKEVFSASEQVKPVADVILVVRVVTVEFSGFEATMVLISVTMVMSQVSKHSTEYLHVYTRPLFEGFRIFIRIILFPPGWFCDGYLNLGCFTEQSRLLKVINY